MKPVMILTLLASFTLPLIADPPNDGYLYFALARNNKKASHELEYILNGQKVSLKLD